MDADLTALGTTDWVIWNAWSGTTGVEYDSKSGGSAIGALSYSGGTANVTENAAGMQFDYTDGTTFTGTQSNINEGIGRRIQNGAGSPDGTLFLSATLPAATNTINLFLSSNNRTISTTLTASIGSDSGSTTFGFSDYADYEWQYKIDVSGAAANDVINISWAGDGGDFQSRLIANAATLAIPEPSAVVLLGLGVLGLVARRRRS